MNGFRVIGILPLLMSHLFGEDLSQGLQGVLFDVADIGWCGVGAFFALSRLLKFKARF